MNPEIPRVGGDRPFVTLNMAAAIDGKITTVDRGQVGFGGAEDRARMEELRADADGVLIGGGTLRAEDPALTIRDPALRERRLRTKGAAQPLNIVVGSDLPEDLGTLEFFHEPGTEKVLFTTGRVSPGRREAAGRFARVEVVAADEGGRADVAEVVRRLPALGVHHLLLEGGGELNFSMLQADLIDEIYLTLCPLVFGGRAAPTVFDGDGFPRDAIRTLSLQDVRVGSHGVVFLRYFVLRG
jgi:riboflavin-specific deaminase-like protein